MIAPSFSVGHTDRYTGQPLNQHSGLPKALPAGADGALCRLGSQIQEVCQGASESIPQAVRQALDAVLADEGGSAVLSQVLSLPRAEQTYTRHILYADPAGQFTVVALVWGAGHCSPIHAHHTWCAYKVLSGTLTEAHFEWNHLTETARQVGHVQRQAGQSVAGHAGLDLIHSIGNTARALPMDTATANTPAVSVHVYGMDQERIGTHVNRVVALSA